MKKLLTVIPLVILLCFTFSCQKQAEETKPTVDIEADIEALKSITDKVMKAFNEGDLESFMTTITDDAVFMPPGEPVIIGKEAIRNWYNFDKIGFDVTISVDEIEVCGDWAFLRATWIGTQTQKESDETTEFKATDMSIHRRQPDGSWKTSHAIWNFTSMETREN